MVKPPPKPRSRQTVAPKGQAAHLKVGELGEELVADWLQGEGVTVLERRWACLTGELDLVALLPEGGQGEREPVLAFIEVKTRRRGSWDKGGLLAITPQKQNKLWRTARFFLKKHPHYRELPCRFDVALVRCQAIKRPTIESTPTEQLSLDNLPQATSSPAAPTDEQQPSRSETPIKLGEPITRSGYRLTLDQYIANAFSL